MWGVAQYLYGLPNEWVPIKPQGKSFVIDKSPSLPVWATPNGYGRITASEKKQVYEQIAEALSKGDEHGLREVWDEYGNEEKIQLWPMFDSKIRKAMNAILDDKKVEVPK